MSELLAITSSLLREDVESGHVKVLAEVIGASDSDPVLKRAVVTQVRPWLEFTQATLERVLDHHGLATFPADQFAFGVVSLFLGAELLSTVAGEEPRVADLLNGLAPAVRLLDGLSSVPPRHGGVG